MLYRAAALLAQEWMGAAPGDDSTPLVRSLDVFGAPTRRMLALLDFIPVRLTALSFAVVGDFEDAVDCWRRQAATWPVALGGTTIGTLLASGGGALGVVLGGPLPTLAGEPEPRPEMGAGEPVEPDMIAVCSRTRVARAYPVAVADPAADAGQSRPLIGGAVALRRARGR